VLRIYCLSKFVAVLLTDRSVHVVGQLLLLKPAFHDADTDIDILARILADTSDTRDFLKLFLWQAERHADILATILARMSVSASWNASFTKSATSTTRYFQTQFDQQSFERAWTGNQETKFQSNSILCVFCSVRMYHYGICALSSAYLWRRPRLQRTNSSACIAIKMRHRCGGCISSRCSSRGQAGRLTGLCMARLAFQRWASHRTEPELR